MHQFRLINAQVIPGLLLATSLFTTTAAAQDIIGGGFAITGSQPTPAAFASYDTLPSGDRIVFDGLSIDRYDSSGTIVQNLAILPGFVFNSFVEADPSSSFALVGESSNGDIFRVALDGSGYTTLANLQFNFDAVFEDANNVLISAATCGFGCGNDIVRVNTTTGSTTFVANVAGASGPVDIDDQGRLYYGTIDTVTPNNSKIISWNQTQLHSGPVLDESDAIVLVSGLGGAGALAIDPIFGNVFLAESIFGGTSRILEFDVSNGSLVDVIVESPDYLTSVELMLGRGIGHFHAYQPEDGVFMHYNGQDEIITIRPQRPTASISQSGAVATLSVQNAEPNGGMLVLFSNAGNFDPNYISVQLSFNFLFHSSVPIGQIQRTPLLIPIDATGSGSFQYFDPGNLQGTKVFQALITDSNGGFIGSTTAALN
jgi:hypothetical protein